MLNKKTIWRTGLIGFVVFFVVGVVHLFQLRFEAGDIYPPYSSLRSDPLGTLALYESLNRLDAVETSRAYKPITPKDVKDIGATLMYLGLSPSARGPVQETLANPLLQLVSRGGRVVVTFVPIRKAPTDMQGVEADEIKEIEKTEDSASGDGTVDSSDEAPDAEPSPMEADEAVDQNEPDEAPFDHTAIVSLESKWSVGFRYFETEPDDDTAVGFRAVASSENLPEVSWHSRLYFDAPASVWQTIYTVGGHPVIIERSLGRGTLILCADSYFLSNEALRDEPHPKLLTWLVGGHRRIVFDEFHHGVAKRSGVVSLIRKYDLHWVLLGFAVLAVLFVWQRAAPFMAPLVQTEIDTDGDIHQTKDYTQGLISLLRRNVVAKDLISVCIKEWQSAFHIQNRLKAGRRSDLDHAVATLQDKSDDRSDPVIRYNLIRRISVEKK